VALSLPPMSGYALVEDGIIGAVLVAAAVAVLWGRVRPGTPGPAGALARPPTGGPPIPP
jgi:hypothetical protein